jgi:hypothetical protein
MDTTIESAPMLPVAERVAELEVNDAEVYWLAKKAVAALVRFDKKGRREDLRRACRLADAMRALVPEAA